MKITLGLLILVLAIMQQQIWFGDSGYFERKALAQRHAQQQQRTQMLIQRNAKMTAEILALKSDAEAFESRARSELGMVKDGEVFYLIPEDDG
ncbi:MAG: septum formation initiator family protein [Gammaproteobacteria bacterium]|jgi:cell division protein FtsB